MRDVWNKCDECGRFIAMADFDKGAVRRMVYPDSDRSAETWETLCRDHGEQSSGERSDVEQDAQK